MFRTYSYLYVSHVVLCLCICHSVGLSIVEKWSFLCLRMFRNICYITVYGLWLSTVNNDCILSANNLKKYAQLFGLDTWVMAFVPVKFIENERLLVKLKCWYDMKWTKLARKHQKNTYPQSRICKSFWMTWRQHLFTFNYISICDMDQMVENSLDVNLNLTQSSQ